MGQRRRRVLFSSLKKERIQQRIYKTGDLARADIFDYSEVFCNRTHSIAISTASVARPLSGPRREEPACLPFRGKST